MVVELIRLPKTKLRSNCGSVKRTLPPISLAYRALRPSPHPPFGRSTGVSDAIAVLEKRDQELSRQPQQIAKIGWTPLDTTCHGVPQAPNKQLQLGGRIVPILLDLDDLAGTLQIPHQRSRIGRKSDSELLYCWRFGPGRLKLRN
jgi:hypothetical protein